MERGGQTGCDGRPRSDFAFLSFRIRHCSFCCPSKAEWNMHTHTYIHIYIYACIDREGGQAKALSCSKMWPKACLSADMPMISEEQFASCKEQRTAAPEDHCEFEQKQNPNSVRRRTTPLPTLFHYTNAPAAGRRPASGLSFLSRRSA